MTSTERSIFPYHMRSIAFHNMHTLHQHHRLSLPCCCPPRLLRNGRMSPSADVYSFGILSEWDLLLVWAWQFASLPRFACFFSSSTTGSRLHLCTRSSVLLVGYAFAGCKSFFNIPALWSSTGVCQHKGWHHVYTNAQLTSKLVMCCVAQCGRRTAASRRGRACIMAWLLSAWSFRGSGRLCLKICLKSWSSS